MIDSLYHLIDILIPFEWAHYVFMKNALIAVLLVTPVFGLLGTLVVSNRMSFFSDAIGHSTLTGIAIGTIIGIPNPLWAMIAFSIIFAIGISLVKNMVTASTDTVIGVFSSIAVALGITILSRGGGFNKYSSYLIGDLLSISPKDILMLALMLVVILLFWIFAYNKLLLVGVNQSLAASRGIKTRIIEILFTVIIAITVTISIQWVGLLIINSILVLPAAAARNLSGNSRQYHAISVGISVFAGITGLILSYYWSTATGATIILVTAVMFFVSLAFRHKFN